MQGLNELYRAQGAQLADDGIPLRFSTEAEELAAADSGVVLMDRSHEARVRLNGADRYALLQRISTNNVEKLTPGTGCATIFTSAIGRVLDRVEVLAEADSALLLGGPGRAEPLTAYLRQNIFFRDQVKPEDITDSTRAFALHGPQANALAEALLTGAGNLPLFHGLRGEIAGVSVLIARAKPLTDAHLRVIVLDAAQAPAVWTAISDLGIVYGLRPAGSLTYNLLRIRAGSPAVGHELTPAFIPLELGLWDEVSFNKGCYTGQEILARMESRGKLAKTLITLELDALVELPATLTLEGRRVGQLTSVVRAPDGQVYAVGLVQPALAEAGQTLQSTDGVNGRISLTAGNH